MTILQYVIDFSLLVLLLFIGYCLLQVVDVIREEKERLMWYRQAQQPVLNDEDDYNEPVLDQAPETPKV